MEDTQTLHPVGSQGELSNAQVSSPLQEPDQKEMPQCLEESPTKPCESKEQREQRRRIEVLKNWEIRIQPLDRGCVIHVGCKSIAFTSIEAAYKEIGRYIENPQLVATQHGFGDHF